MRVYRIAQCNYSDLSGVGAFHAGGRWNSKGLHLLYSSSTSSLAILEVLAHGIKPAAEYCMSIIELPDDAIQELHEQDLPDDWMSIPAPDSTKHTGDRFLLECTHLALSVPSVVNPSERNILINPMHPDFRKVKLVSIERLGVDPRLSREKTKV